MRRKSLGKLTVLALVPALALAACGGGDGGKSAGGGGGSGGTVTVGMRTDFQPINPITAGDQYTIELINYGLFTPLVQYDENLKVTPYLAESWDMTDTAVTFHLRHDVRWHDGKPVTAEDVKFTFDMAKDPASGSLIGSAYIANVKSAAVVDSYTVHFTYTQPHAQALEDFWWAPAPKHLLQNSSAQEMRNAAFNRNPVGSGPFKFSQWQSNQRLVVEKNPDFPATLGGPPKLDRIVFRIIPEPSTMQTELVTGGLQVDVPVAPDQTKALKQSDAINVIGFPGKSLYYIGWNNKRAPFTSVKVRRALAMSINRQEIIDALLFGQGAPAISTVPPWHPLYPKDAKALPYDVAEAGKLLDEEGWKDSNGDGIRDKGGKPLRFTLMTSENPLNRSVVEVIQSQLKKVGVDAQVRTLEFQTLLTQHKGRDFDAVFTSWVLDNFQMAGAPASLLHSRLASVPNSSNRSSVNIPALDRLIDQASAATDDNQAIGVWKQMSDLLQSEQPVTFIYWLNELAANRKEVSGVKMDPRGELLTMQQWTMGKR
ncbi:MAG TPA: ABC transporter substrate-binding protein [Longimicrobiales bacterium]|nr:ABC transporter substrate-binding protein [Longimicrobiales bacterium]